MEINRNSWHFKLLCKLHNDYPYRPANNLCTYRKNIITSILIHLCAVTFMAGITISCITAIGVLFLIVYDLLVLDEYLPYKPFWLSLLIGTCICVLIRIITKNIPPIRKPSFLKRTKKEKKPKPPSLMSAIIVDIKEQVCTKITYKD